VESEVGAVVVRFEVVSLVVGSEVVVAVGGAGKGRTLTHIHKECLTKKHAYSFRTCVL